MLAWRTPGKGAVPGETGVREGFLEEMTFWGQNFPDTASWWAWPGKARQEWWQPDQHHQSICLPESHTPI